MPETPEQRQQRIDQQRQDAESKKNNLTAAIESLRADRDIATDKQDKIINSLDQLVTVAQSHIDIAFSMNDLLANSFEQLNQINDNIEKMLNLRSAEINRDESEESKNRLNLKESGKEKLGDAAKKASEGIKDILGDTIGRVLSIFGFLLTAVTLLAIKFGALFDPDGPEARALFKSIDDVIKIFVYGPMALKFLGSLIGGVGNFIKSLGGTAKSLQAVADQSKKVNIAKGIGGFITGIGGFIKAFGGFFGMISKVIAPLRVLMVAFDFLFAAVPQFMRTLEKTGDVPRAIFDAIVSGLAAVVGSLFKAFTDLLGFLLSAIGLPDLGAWVTGIGNQVYEGINSFFADFSQKISDFWNSIGSAFSGFSKGIEDIGNQIKGAWDSIVGGLRDAIIWLNDQATDLSFWKSEEEKKREKANIRKMFGVDANGKPLSSPQPTRTQSLERSSQAVTHARVGGNVTNVVAPNNSNSSSVTQNVTQLPKAPVAIATNRTSLSGAAAMPL